MPHYFLTMPHDSESEPTMATMDPDELAAVMEETGAFRNALVEAGAFVYSAGLHPPSSAKTIDGTGSEILIEDGPLRRGRPVCGRFLGDRGGR